MRDILNLLDTLNEGVGLANRKSGDLFKNPQGDVIEFQGLTFYPEVGRYQNSAEMLDAAQQLGLNVHWVNTPKGGTNSPTEAFGIATFTTQDGQEYYLGKYFTDIKANRRDNKFEHDRIPGDFKYQSGRGATENAGYQPSQVLTRFDNNTPESIAQQIIAKFGDDSSEAQAIKIFIAAKDFPVTIPAGNMNFNAFSVYFAEMLQPIAFVKGMTVKENAQDCVDIYFGPGQSLVGTTISFNADKGGMLSDSMLTNSEGKSINLSTKNATGGAKASAQNLKIEFEKLKASPQGAKLLAKHQSVLDIINKFGKDTHYSAPLEIAVDKQLITEREAAQVMMLKNANLGLGEDPNQFLSKRLMTWYNEALTKRKEPVVPIHTIMLIIAKKVVEYVNTKTNFSSAASDILNNGALIQVNSLVKKSGDNFVFEGLNSHYPSKAVTGVMLSTEKAYWYTGAQGNMPFKILFNGAKPEKEDDAEAAGSAPVTSPTTVDLDAVTQRRSKVTARAGGVEPDKKLGSEKTLGRKRQK